MIHLIFPLHFFILKGVFGIPSCSFDEMNCMFWQTQTVHFIKSIN